MLKSSFVRLKLKQMIRLEIEELRRQLISVQESETDEVERLRRELREALDKLAEYRDSQKRLERGIKLELAKVYII